MQAKNEIISKPIGDAPLGELQNKNFTFHISHLTSHHRGITLIALIITIILMIILVGVTVNVALNGGLFKTAQDAAEDTEYQADFETLQAAVVASMDENLEIPNAQSLLNNLPNNQWSVNGADGGPYTAISPNENKFTINTNGEIEYKEPATGDLALLEKYFIGEDGEGGYSIMDFQKNKGFIKNDIIKDADTSLILKSMELIGLTPSFMNKETGIVYLFFIQYNNNIYVISYEYNDDHSDAIATAVELAYEPNGNEGKKVLYSYDGKQANEEEWFIINDEGEYLEIIPPDLIGSFTLGGTTVSEAADQYNNAITIINEYCESLITNPNKVSVRSLGSNPDNPNSENSTLYNPEDDGLSEDFLNEFKEKHLILESGDTNFIQDLGALQFYNKLPLYSEECLLASRWKPFRQSGGANVACVYTLGTINYGYWLGEGTILRFGDTTSNISAVESEYGVCPVVKVRADSVEVIE